jgi:hypothetical protein
MATVLLKGLLGILGIFYVGRGVCLGSLFELSDVHVMSRDSARASCIYLSGHRAPDTSSS